MRIRFYTIVLTVFSVFMGLQAQDIHFSQFYMSPLTLNPAMTGVMNCNVRLVANYRNQWASVLQSNAFNTFSASYDEKRPVGRNDYFGFGGTLWGDVAGTSRFATLAANVSGSYSKHLGGGRSSSHYVVFGAEIGIRQRSIKNLLELRFGDQFNSTTGEIDGVTQETFTNFNNNFLFADLSGGVLYFAVLDDHTSFWLGGAFHHINQPNQSFFDGEFSELHSKYTIHGGGEKALNKKISVLPGVVMLFQGEAFELNGGSSVRIDLSQNQFNYQAVQFGAWIRLANSVTNIISTDPSVPNTQGTSLITDALIFSTKFDYNKFGIGFSYDINLSSLRPASNGNGAFEFSLIYNICRQEQRGVYCPKF